MLLANYQVFSILSSLYTACMKLELLSTYPTLSMHMVLCVYSWKFGRGTKFGGLVVYLYKCQIRNPPIFHTCIQYTYDNPLIIKPKNLKLPIFLQQLGYFGAQPPNLIPANISSYMIMKVMIKF